MSTDKIFNDPEALVPHLDECRSRGLTIVFGNGCFELLHIGHVRYLQEARSLGDVLVVAVNSDESLKANKPDRDPVQTADDRMELLAALECTSYVVPLRERTPVRLIELFRPHIHTKGSDYTLDTIPEREVVERHGGRVAIVGGPKIRNTSDMLAELRKR